MIFYADDDFDDLEIFKEIATSIGRTVFTFSGGEDLMDQLRNPPPKASIVFLDFNMPKKNGLEILREIRNSPFWKFLPIVILTTGSDEKMIGKLRKAGANLYINKSNDFTAFFKTLENVLSVDFYKHETTDENFRYDASKPL